MFRVGIGYDIHPFTESNELILGGVKINYKYGLQGHSDADVLLHALMDAILGALAKGDIGSHFPDDDPCYKNIASILLLKEVVKMVSASNYCMNNVDLIVICEKPKLAVYRQEIVNRLSEILNLEKTKINFKATTHEKLGTLGRGEGIAAQAVVSLINNKLVNDSIIKKGEDK